MLAYLNDEADVGRIDVEDGLRALGEGAQHAHCSECNGSAGQPGTAQEGDETGSHRGRLLSGPESAGRLAREDGVAHRRETANGHLTRRITRLCHHATEEFGGQDGL